MEVQGLEKIAEKYIQENFDENFKLSSREKVDGVKGWRRVLVKDMMYLLGISKDKQLNLMAYLVTEMDSNNKICFKNLEELSNQVNISRQSCSKYLKELCELNFIKELSKNNYIINPAIISPFGKEQKQVKLITEYKFNLKNNQIDKKIILKK